MMNDVKVTVAEDRLYTHYGASTWAIEDGFLKVYRVDRGKTTLVATYNPRFWVRVSF